MELNAEFWSRRFPSFEHHHEFEKQCMQGIPVVDSLLVKSGATGLEFNAEFWSRRIPSFASLSFSRDRRRVRRRHTCLDTPRAVPSSFAWLRR